MTTSALPPADAIQRILFLCSKVHIYSIPPLTSNKGHVAATWTENNNARQIFTARLRILETSIPPPPSAPSGSPENLSVEILLEDPATGDLFAGAPYQDKSAVETAIDSSRFFAVRVVGDGGRRATLGVGFEDRSEAIDFGICLQECRKILGLDEGTLQGPAKGVVGKVGTQENVPEKRDWSLKEGETIKVDIGRRGRRQDKSHESQNLTSGSGDNEKALFSIKPPPGFSVEKNNSMPTLAPPPSVTESRAEKRRSRGLYHEKIDAKQLGFDDGEFGEFQ